MLYPKLYRFWVIWRVTKPYRFGVFWRVIKPYRCRVFWEVYYSHAERMQNAACILRDSTDGTAWWPTHALRFMYGMMASHV